MFSFSNVNVDDDDDNADADDDEVDLKWSTKFVEVKKFQVILWFH